MSLRFRLAGAFALVALLTAAVVALATPIVVGRGFARMATEDGVTPGGMGRGQGQMTRLHAADIELETTLTLVAVALAAAGGATVLGLLIANRIARPLGSLESAAAAVAGGDLSRRTGLAARTDELGSLGRSFDAMAAGLESADSSRRRFFQDAVHELKTPLAVIDATTTAVLDGVYAHEDRHLETIRGQSRLLARLVDDLRTVSLAEARALPLTIEDADLADAAGEVTVAHRAAADARGVALRSAVPAGLRARVDPARLRQVLGALLDNAIRHTPAGGEILVEGARVPDGGAQVAVRDTGPGVPVGDLPHVFERFYQADPGRDRGSATSGLGLSIVKALVEAHGGSVGAENVAGGGARFWFTLPEEAR